MKTILAALLHDIGKFYQRTGIKVSFDDTDKSYIKYNKFKKTFSHYHAAYTSKFISDTINHCLPDFNEFLNLASSHHIDNSIIRDADIIASGHDRDKPTELDEKEAYEDDEFKKDIIDNRSENDRYSYITTRMSSIFNEITSDNTSLNYHDIVKLSSYSQYKRAINDHNINRQVGCSEYKELFNKFTEHLKTIDGYTSYSELHNYLYPLLKEYTLTIPAATYMQKNTTVSLFDHLKLTAAIVGCLEKNKSNKYFALVDYDVSGIQKFIYQVTEGENTKKNVAKMLRSRSFYLNVITDFFAYYIVNEFGLSYENILYSSGGRGRILLPYIDDIEEKLKNINLNIEKALYKKHHMDISFLMSYSRIDDEELQKSSLSDLIDLDEKKFISRKNQKFKSLIGENFNFINDHIHVICKYCGTNETINNDKCEICNELLQLNEFIVKNKSFIIEFDYNDNNSIKCFSIKFNGIGRIIFNKTLVNKNAIKDNYYITINNYNCSYWLGELKYYAVSNIGGKNFEEIAKESIGDKKLAVIKMDVDNLGYIFMKGIKVDRNTISKNLTLSRMIDYFFTKKVVHICNQDKYKKSIYINYSGGDDLVIITPASMSISLVNDIINNFNQFIGYNKNITISAGIEIFNPSSPVRFAILRAENQLEKSKNYQIDSKNATSVLNCSVSNERIDQLEKDIDKYVNMLNVNELSTTCLYNIYTAILVSLEHEKEVDAFKRYIPQIAYTIKRNISNKTQFDMFRKIFVSSSITKEELEYYKIVFGYSLMITRRTDKENDNE